jgi:hypothetical protein
MAEIQLDIYGARSEDKPALEHELSKIFGSPAEAEETLSDMSAMSFVVELANSNLPLVAGLIIALAQKHWDHVRLRFGEFELELNHASSAKEVMSVLQAAQAQRR